MLKKNKILFLSLSNYKYIGGIQNYNKSFLHSLLKNNLDYFEISLHDQTKVNSKCLGCNSNIFIFIYSIFKELRSKNYSMIICSHIHLSIISILIKIFFSVKTILIVHGIEVWKKPNLYIKKIVQKFDFFLSVSEFTKKKLCENFFVNVDDVFILPNSLDDSLKNISSLNNPYNKCDFNILTVLRLEKSKKLESIYFIIDALKKINNNKIKFYIIGNGSQRKKIKNYVFKKKLKKNVFVKGFVKNTQHYFANCDLFSLISDREGFGIVYLEAMRFSKVCLSAKNCGSEDVVINDYNGFSFDKNNINELSNKIIKLKNNKKLKKKLGDNGFFLFKKKFTQKIFIKTQSEILKKII